MATPVTDASIEALRAAGDPVRVRYVGPANGRELTITRDDGEIVAYAWRRHIDSNEIDVEAADLEAVMTIPGDEFEIVDETTAPDESRGGHDASTR